MIAYHVGVREKKQKSSPCEKCGELVYYCDEPMADKFVHIDCLSDDV